MRNNLKNRWFVLAFTGIVFLFTALIPGMARGEKLGPALRTAINSGSLPQTVNVWVLFKDKGSEFNGSVSKSLAIADGDLTQRALERRERRGNTEELVGTYDLPVRAEYIDRVLAIDGAQKLRTTTRWLNGISISCHENAIESIAVLDFVRTIQLVKTGYTEPRETNEAQPGYLAKRTAQLAYGLSYDQLEQINVPALHDLGYSGAGVRVLMIDTGYDTAHQFLSRERIVAEYDFIHDDSITTNQPEDYPVQDYHGTSTASAVGAAVDSMLYGPAYRCEFLLAKTEIYDQEIQVEEDYYVEALEWGERLGADVVSSSLGYTDWYEFSDMDGNTAVTTLAVERAILLGMVVVTAVGNENQNNWGHIIAPADANTVISVGAIDANGQVAGFSSRGPTYDGRIKPEVVARGVNTVAASSQGPDNYVYASGTSLSTPLVAGVAALLVEGHPEWSPLQIREALMMTAGNADHPNNTIGWGIVDALAAMNYVPAPKPDTLILADNFPNPFRNATYIKYTIPSDETVSEVSVDIYNVRGQWVTTLRNHSADSYFRWEPPADIASGMYLYRIKAGQYSTTGKLLLVR